LFLCALGVSGQAVAAPYAALVMDARNGKVLYSKNADTRLHPASLTKMMTLYIVFQAVENGEISMDTRVKISRKAASEPPSKLGLRPGQRIKLRYLVRAAAVKSANDAATALGEAISGSEAAFARRMNRTAKALGMTRTTFKNANGLTESGHLSTARDMALLGRHLFFDHPAYYNLFSRRTTDAGMRQVSNTNRRFLAAYEGADGIKTGYTRAAGFNLVASARRGNERIIASVFGGRSTSQRNAKMAELLDLGFRKAPSQATVRAPDKPRYVPGARDTGAGELLAGKILRVQRAVKTSPFPVPRPGADVEEPSTELLVAMSESIEQAVTAVQVQPLSAATAAPPDPEKPSVTAVLAAPAPKPRPVRLASAAPNAPASPERVVVTRLSTSGGRLWGINVGRYGSRYQAERVLLKTALAEMDSLGDALRKVSNQPRGFEANFVGMTRESADLACLRLQARNINCKTMGPS
jgi:D-alanyl-D-alanine carboxypeptidase